MNLLRTRKDNGETAMKIDVGKEKDVLYARVKLYEMSLNYDICMP
jgi:hypothetical protein